MNPYVADILAQPEALTEVVSQSKFGQLALIRNGLQNDAYDRIIITGMGSSLNAAYPAFINLTRLATPVLWLNGAELLHTLQNAISKRTLLWINSQSGKSVELVNLLRHIEQVKPATILAFSNDLSSPLAENSQICLPIHAGLETTVSTKTYTNMFAINLLAAEFLVDGDLSQLMEEMLFAAREMETYLSGWQTKLDQLDERLGDFSTLMLLGRGSSMAAVWNGSLINKEAAKCAFEGMHAADFRHGPLELVETGFTAFVFAGPKQTTRLNRKLALEIVAHGGRVFYIDDQRDPELPTIQIPTVSERTRPVLEIIPLQMLSVVMAERKSIVAGHFRYVGKITSTE
jgi:glucosamine--fructose-6-phosphate aminotransferase (isomerizing)